MVMLRAVPSPRQPQSPSAGAGFLKPARSSRTRAYSHERAALGATLPRAVVAGTCTLAVIDLWVTLVNGSKQTRYGVSLCGWTDADGLLAVWYKLAPDGRYSGTHYNLTFTGFAASCDCPACCYEATSRADRRHGNSSGSFGCQKLDTFAALVVVGAMPNPQAALTDRRN